METKDKAKFRRANRITAIVIAVIWICGGVAGLWIYISDNKIILLVISLLAIGYGILWIKVVKRGKKLDWSIIREKVK